MGKRVCGKRGEPSLPAEKSGWGIKNVGVRGFAAVVLLSVFIFPYGLQVKQLSFPAAWMVKVSV